jgi:co-chaperonin GroES (HSP10)
MQILGNRLLVSRIEEEDTGGFKAIDVQDSFVYKGLVEESNSPEVAPGSVVLFAKYSPNTQEIPVDGKTMKIISISDVLAVL